MTSMSSAKRFIASFLVASRLAAPRRTRLPQRCGSRGLSLGLLLSTMLLILFAAVPNLAAQAGTATAAAPAPAVHKPVHHKRKTVAAKTAQVEAAAVPAPPPAPAEPEAPHWPINDKPTPATVTWDSQGLRVEAENASLAQILQDVATVTGATVEGFDDDRRIYGSYGPGQAREILSQLLQGTGYNVVMVGDLGQGAPRQIVLTLRTEAKAAKAVKVAEKKAGDDDDDDADDQPAAQPSAPPNRTPQDMQRRRQPPNPQTDATRPNS
jgi:hypothetical protein